MKNKTLMILGIIILLVVGGLLIYFLIPKQDNNILASAKNYFKENSDVINSETVVITSTNNLINKNELDKSYQNKLIKVSYKNEKVIYEEIDSYTFTNENYHAVEVVNNNSVVSKSLFYEDSDNKYYISDAKNYFIKQDNVLIPLFDVIYYNYISKSKLINIIPLEKESKKEVEENDNTQIENNEVSNNTNKNEETNDNKNDNDNDINIDKPIINDKVDETDKNTNIIIPSNPIIKDDIIITKDFVIEDRGGDYCAQAIDEFWKDSTGIYYFTCQKSGSIYIVFKNGEEYTLKEALNKGKVTIDELYEKGLRPLKKNITYVDR